jgi:three-Cys-motif partner protein
LLREYLTAWFPKLSSAYRRIVFIDGFAGPGVNPDGSPGSPVIALQTLLRQPSRVLRPDRQFVFLFVEKSTSNFASLKAAIAGVGPLPANVIVRPVRGEFAQVAASVLKGPDGRSRHLAPTFAFIDPFGFSGIPMTTIRDLLGFRGCEVFVNLMADHINRFATVRRISPHLDELFGCSDYLQAHKSASGGVEFLVDLYERQLREVAGFDYVRSFEMQRADGHAAYYLVHGTRHIEGVAAMKRAMWKVDPGAGSSFSDRLAGLQMLFDPSEFLDLSPLRKALVERFGSDPVPVEQVEEFTILVSPYSPDHWNARTLKPMEAEGQLEVISAKPNRRRGQFPPGTVIRFLRG